MPIHGIIHGESLENRVIYKSMLVNAKISLKNCETIRDAPPTYYEGPRKVFP